MKIIEDKIIMYDSPEAAQVITLTGWVSGGDNRFFYKDEHLARWSGCTHLKCDCGNTMKKSYTKCENCRYSLEFERYLKLPYVEWDLVTPVVERGGDTYFFNVDDLEEYMEENCTKDINLLLCVPCNYSIIDSDQWCENEPENGDGTLPDEMQKAVDALNTIIKRMPPQSYMPGKIRTSYEVSS